MKSQPFDARFYAVPTWKNDIRIAENFNHVRIAQIFTNYFSKKKRKKAKESKPRTKKLDEEYIIPRNEKIYTDESSSLSRRETTNDSFVRGKANWSVGGEKAQR